eukprot:TRINITY_DN2375_c0_g1_i2.p1 TRINITY_DN2375_c0_g1~~TRINITY_DN2375_c0_g1_i2.p1  ORF type:complete len:722 (-),score=155.59 TRINITY_DN2375_c0_g1_i2:304-2469(-)
MSHRLVIRRTVPNMPDLSSHLNRRSISRQASVSRFSPVTDDPISPLLVRRARPSSAPLRSVRLPSRELSPPRAENPDDFRYHTPRSATQHPSGVRDISPLTERGTPIDLGFPLASSRGVSGLTDRRNRQAEDVLSRLADRDEENAIDEQEEQRRHVAIEERVKQFQEESMAIQRLLEQHQLELTVLAESTEQPLAVPEAVSSSSEEDEPSKHHEKGIYQRRKFDTRMAVARKLQERLDHLRQAQWHNDAEWKEFIAETAPKRPKTLRYFSRTEIPNVREMRAQWLAEHERRWHETLHNGELLKENFIETVRQRIAWREEVRLDKLRSMEDTNTQEHYENMYIKMQWLNFIVLASRTQYLVKRVARSRIVRTNMANQLRAVSVISRAARIFLFKRIVLKRHLARQRVESALIRWAIHCRVVSKNRSSDILTPALQRVKRINNWIEQFRARRAKIITVQSFWRKCWAHNVMMLTQLVLRWDESEKQRWLVYEKIREEKQKTLRDGLRALRSKLPEPGVPLRRWKMKQESDIQQITETINNDEFFDEVHREKTVSLPHKYGVLKDFLVARRRAHLDAVDKYWESRRQEEERRNDSVFGLTEALRSLIPRLARPPPPEFHLYPDEFGMYDLIDEGIRRMLAARKEAAEAAARRAALRAARLNSKTFSLAGVGSPGSIDDPSDPTNILILKPMSFPIKTPDKKGKKGKKGKKARPSTAPPKRNDGL